MAVVANMPTINDGTVFLSVAVHAIRLMSLLSLCCRSCVYLTGRTMYGGTHLKKRFE